MHLTVLNICGNVPVLSLQKSFLQYPPYVVDCHDPVYRQMKATHQQRTRSHLYKQIQKQLMRIAPQLQCSYVLHPPFIVKNNKHVHLVIRSIKHNANQHHSFSIPRNYSSKIISPFFPPIRCIVILNNWWS